MTKLLKFKVLVFSLFMVVPAVGFGAGVDEPTLCSAGFSQIEFDLDRHTVRSLDILEFVRSLLRMDIEARISILDYNYPEDLRDSVPSMMLKGVSALKFEEAIGCILREHLPGDNILEYFIRNELGSERGYVLHRNGKLVAIVVVEQKLV